jgi:ATP-dependent RNA helicase DDX24/MAK5
MQQKARLGAMESLSKRNARSVLIATDVAAHSLDIPAVATVIHFDVPGAADLFVHRAGLTARGMGENAIGWSVSLISADEDKNHRFICESILGEGKRHFDEAPMDGRLLSSAQERVNLASKIVSHSDIESKTNKHNQWFINAAKEAELDLEDDMLDDDIINKGDQKIG